MKSSEFNSYIKPIFDEEECEKYGLDTLQDEALKKNKIEIPTLEAAPDIKTVWKLFTEYVKSFNYKNTRWNAPIKAGYNINGFDDIIVDRICGGNTLGFPTDKKEPYKFGPWDDDYKTEALFHPIHNIDAMRYMWAITENKKSIKSISMDSLREWLGMSTEGAHNAVVDVKQGAELLIRILRMFRHFMPRVKFEGAFK